MNKNEKAEALTSNGLNIRTEKRTTNQFKENQLYGKL